MKEHTKQALRDYVTRQQNSIVTNEAIDRAVDALAERMYQDYDTCRDDPIRRLMGGMREIKFRAWIGDRYEHDVMTHRGEVVFASEEWVLGDDGEYAIDSVVRYKADIEQFTGLRDKNGREIYEGDILLYAPYDNLGHDEKKRINVVVWGQTGDSDGYAHGKHYEWTVGGDSLADVADSDYPDEAYCEVIGNIHENPELIDEGENGL